VKKVKTAATGTDTAVVQTSLNAAVKALDKAAQRGLIHKNAAARRKARAAKAANKALLAK
jgi:small subunit ribosomal protein S20